ncbi:MAG TPA: response regulator [Bryobacteraceae bacterium]|nr:response regulator [Bryobacteraceae bacterium]
MDAKCINVLLIEDSPDYAELVQQWLASAEGEVSFVLNWTDSLAAGLSRLHQGSVDAVLLDLGLPDSAGLETFLQTRRHAPGLPIVILTAADSESLALRVIQEGAEDYLVKSKCNGELLVKTLHHAVLRHKQLLKTPSAPVEQAKLIGVAGVKGGVGTTTVACTLAAALCNETGQKVLLADLDLSSGSAAFLMGLDPKYSIADAITDVDRLDRNYWDGLVAHASTDLTMIASPGILGADALTTQGFRKLFTLIRPFYQWIVIDFGRLGRSWQSLADEVDQLFLVTTSSIAALYDSKRVTEAVLKGGLDRGRLHFIVNQTEDVQALSGGELQHFFGVPVSASLPKVSQEVHEACCQGKLPAKTGAIGRKMAQLARNIAGLKEKRAKGSFLELLPFIERFRESDDDVAKASKG